MTDFSEFSRLSSHVAARFGNCLRAAAACILMILATTAAQARQLGEVTEKDVDIIVDDGQALRGTYFSSEKSGPGVLLLNMCNPGIVRDSWAGLGRLLAARGFHVLTLDYRGTGESEGEPPSFRSLDEAKAFWKTSWLPDIEDAYRWLRSQSGVTPETSGIGGGSCGCFLALEMSRRYPEIQTAVLLAGPIDETHEQFAKDSGRPLLIATSADDGPAPQWMNDLFAASSHPQTTLIQYKSTGHGTDMFETVPELEETIARWFGKWLVEDERAED